MGFVMSKELPFEYDPQATYPNTGQRGCSSLQVTRMNIDKHERVYATIPNFDMRYMVVVALTKRQLEMLMADDPQAFDDVQPV
jgi:hypothetical protein